MQIIFPAGGWLPPGAHFDKQRTDKGEDFVTNWRGVIQAPGNWECVAIGADGPFPDGFGPGFPIVKITSGPFQGHQPYYIGHCTTLVRLGDRGGFGHGLARANQGHNYQGTQGGWVELGQQNPDGTSGSDGQHWFRHLLMQPRVINRPDPPLRFGDAGWRVLGMSTNLTACGYLWRPYWHFNQQIHGAVERFKDYHHIPTPAKGDGGVVDGHTDAVLAATARWCVRHHHREVLP